VPSTSQRKSTDTTARLLLVAVSLTWGVTWPIMKIALDEIPPFSFRTVSNLLGALTVVMLAMIGRRSLRISPGIGRLHIFIAGTLNVVAFTIFSAFAQLAATTSRVAILAYTMPIWASLLAVPVLGERLTGLRNFALGLCVAGIAILVYPLVAAGVPDGLIFALAAGVSWGAGTVYLKWAKISADPVAIATWQLAWAFVIVTLCLPIFEGPLQIAQAHWPAMLAMIFSGMVGSGLCYLMWFEVVRRLPASTASLGALSVPVVGIASSVLILGERPTTTDLVGFVLIFIAAAAVLLEPVSRARS
jgi:drug/metabolite transporter (DMT)-like permease